MQGKIGRPGYDALDGFPGFPVSNLNRYSISAIVALKKDLASIISCSDCLMQGPYGIRGPKGHKGITGDPVRQDMISFTECR